MRSIEIFGDARVAIWSSALRVMRWAIKLCTAYISQYENKIRHPGCFSFLSVFCFSENTYEKVLTMLLFSVTISVSNENNNVKEKRT